MEINKRLLKEITDYCAFNNIENIEEEINRLLRIGFNIQRFGQTPFTPPSIEAEIPQSSITEIPKQEEKPKRAYKRKPKTEQSEVNEIQIEEHKEQETVVKPKKRVRIIKN